MLMKTDIYTKIILTVIAFCMLFNIIKEIDIISSVKADENIAQIPAPQTLSTLKTNSDGSINVRMVAADVIEVKPAYGAEFKVVPSSYSTTFKIEPYSSSTEFSVKPTSSAKFEVKPASGSKFDVRQASNEDFKVRPANGAVFDVRQENTSSVESEKMDARSLLYPNPANEQITIKYDIQKNEYLTICNINGEMLSHIELDATQTLVSLNISNFPTGTYIYSFGRVSGKFIKK